MTFRLPPLPPMRAFEAAARHLSVKKAAEELHLTASAVSHAVQVLEEWCGADLFDRSGRTLRLTPAGSDLFDRVSGAFADLAEATSRVPGRGEDRVLRLSVAASVAARLLIPRLPAFLDRHPGLSVVLDTSHRRFDAPVEEVDAAVRIADAEGSTSGWTMLARERLMPVAAPSLLKRLGPAEDWRELPIIRITSIPREWQPWSDAAGVSVPLDRSELSVDTVHLGFEAAEAGFGVALGRRPLVDRALADRTLVALGPDLPAATAIWLILAEGVAQRQEIRAFRHWILAELAQLPGPDAGAGVPR